MFCQSIQLERGLESEQLGQSQRQMSEVSEKEEEVTILLLLLPSPLSK